MKAEEKYYRKLVEGYLNKTLTKRELTVFFDLLSRGELDFYLEEDMVSNFPDMPEMRQSRKIFHMWHVVAAASVLLAVGIAFGLFYRQDHHETMVSNVKNIVQPGGNHAVLTLSNGEQVILDNLEQAEEIQESNLNIVNNKEGSIQYDMTKLDLEGVSKEELIAKFHTIETPRGGTYQIILPDGSKVWLNSLSKIRFPLAFAGGERVVEMEGEVFFDIEKNKNQPFVVKSNGQEIKVLGTSFNVNAYEDEPFVRTTLLTGQIHLLGANSSVRVKPGEEVLNLGKSLKVQPADIEQAVSWKEGFFRFDKVDIKTLMRQISRWYNVNVKYIGNVSDERFVGKIKRSKDLDELLKIFQDGGMDISLSGRTITVRN